jgi:hypothetical protein
VIAIYSLVQLVFCCTVRPRRCGCAAALARLASGGPRRVRLAAALAAALCGGARALSLGGGGGLRRGGGGGSAARFGVALAAARCSCACGCARVARASLSLCARALCRLCAFGAWRLVPCCARSRCVRRWFRLQIASASGVSFFAMVPALCR